MTSLQILREARQQLLLAEIGALLHNLGKMSTEFTSSITKEDKTFDYQHFLGTARIETNRRWADLGPPEKNRVEKYRRSRTGPEISVLDPIHADLLRRHLIELQLPNDLNNRIYALGDFIEYQDSEWYKGKEQARIALLHDSWWLTHLLERAHDTASGSDKDAPKGTKMRQQMADAVRIASAFGAETCFEREAQRQNRKNLLDTIAAEIDTLAAIFDAETIDECALKQIEASRACVWQVTEKTMRQAVGDTQQPINDITVWDLGSSAAALFKAGAARFLLAPPLPDPGQGDYRRTVDEALRTLQWRLLGVRFDGLAYLSQAHHISDLLGRKQAIGDALDHLQNEIEVNYPLGNEVYRDENGSVFVAPNLDGLLQNFTVPRANEPADDDPTLERYLHAEFDRRMLGELAPRISIEEEKSRAELTLAPILSIPPPPLHARPETVASWWPKGGSPRNELCTVCHLRPQGYVRPGATGGNVHAKAKKARRRKICVDCLDRRQARSKDWSNRVLPVEGEESGADQPATGTTWIDEASDTNARCALITGHFDLDDWLNGTLVSTLSVGTAPDGNSIVWKNPSFARIRRVWETTETFWREIEEELPALVPERITRLRITGKLDWNNDAGHTTPGAYHVYDVNLRGQTLSLVWHEEAASFITADNLQYLVKQLEPESDDWKDPQSAAEWVELSLLDDAELQIEEPGEFRAPATPVGTLNITEIVEIEPANDSAPVIPLLAQPRNFMAIVPAGRALDVAQAITEKYDARMGRVRNRLRLDLGLVFFPRRTPLPAVLDAGRRMLEMRRTDELWTVHSVIGDEQKTDVTFANGVTWSFPYLMGDGKPDEWYSWFTGYPVAETGPIERALARDLRPDSRYWVRPSHVDFEYLDTAGRRLQISYERDESNSARAIQRQAAERRQRPLLLEELADFEHVWALLGVREEGGKGLTVSQVHQFVDAIESKRAQWDLPLGPAADACSSAFRQFIADTLRHTGREWWTTTLRDDERALVQRAALRGWLSDVMSLHMSVLRGIPHRNEETPPPTAAVKSQPTGKEGGQE